MAKQDDSLFLLEVLIDKIVFVKNPCHTDKEDFRTCVNIESENVDPLEICDDEPGVCVAKSCGPFVKTFNSGKSCLFSLKEADISKAMNKFPIRVTVYKALPCGCLPSKIMMGQATIDMTKEFVQARKKFLEDPTAVSYQALKDAFRLTGPDGGADTAEIVMFLRISCFGKLIVTRFQGGGAPTLGSTELQTSNTACGADRGGLAGSPSPCRRARDPYNSMPCEDPDDPCFCAGPKEPTAQKTLCRNTDKYCLHVPKGALLSLPFHQELAEKQKLEIKQSSNTMKQVLNDNLITILDAEQYSKFQPTNTTTEFLNISIGNHLAPYYKQEKDFSILDQYSSTSLLTIVSQSRSMLFENHQNFKSINSSQQSLFSNNKLFGEKETTVYMTFFDEFCRYRNSGTQATASINKCLQVCCKSNTNTNYAPSSIDTIANTSRATSSYLNYDRYYSRYSEVYFWGRKTSNSHSKSGMGSSVSKTSIKSPGQKMVPPVKIANGSIQTYCKNSCTAAQTRKSRGEKASTCTTKAVCIKSEQPCPAANATKGDMIATVSHIKIGPREPCPVYNTDPCRGPKCIMASTGEEQTPVKISTVTNPRRGVFELVIRRMTGAPLAKNELMLEWTPPLSRPSPCGTPCAVPWSSPSPCRSQCVYRPSSSKLKCCKRGCKNPCGPLPPCRPLPCSKCCKPFSRRKPFVSPRRTCSPCKSRPCSPIPPSPCKPRPTSPCKFCGSCRPCLPVKDNTGRPCGPSVLCKPCPRLSCSTCLAPSSPCHNPCSQPCCGTSHYTPCRSSSCLRPCPVGRKRPRKARSQPRISPHRKHKSPCSNRLRNCPVVRCRSMPGPCIACCRISPCPPLKCGSTGRCKFPPCCKSECSVCCG